MNFDPRNSPSRSQQTRVAALAGADAPLSEAEIAEPKATVDTAVTDQWSEDLLRELQNHVRSDCDAVGHRHTYLHGSAKVAIAAALAALRAEVQVKAAKLEVATRAVAEREAEIARMREAARNLCATASAASDKFHTTLADENTHSASYGNGFATGIDAIVDVRREVMGDATRAAALAASAPAPAANAGEETKTELCTSHNTAVADCPDTGESRP